MGIVREFNRLRSWIKNFMFGPRWGNIQYFNPRQIGGLVLWLDATDPDANGILPVSGTNVASWVDKSPLGNSATQGTGANQPLFLAGFDSYFNPKPAIDFAGTQFMSVGTTSFPTADQGRTIFMVLNAQVVDPGYVFGFGTIATDEYFYQSLITNYYIDIGDNSVHTTSTLSDHTSYLFEINYTSGLISTTSIKINQASQSTTTSADSTPNTVIGSCILGDFLNTSLGLGYVGQIAEIIMYDSSLSSDKQDIVSNYLKNKWAI